MKPRTKTKNLEEDDEEPENGNWSSDGVLQIKTPGPFQFLLHRNYQRRLVSVLFFHVLSLVIFVGSSECSNISTSVEVHLSQTPTEGRDTTYENVMDEEEVLLARLRLYWECNREVQQQMLSQAFEQEHAKCPVNFDGWVCWEVAENGSDASVVCPPSYGNQSVRSAANRHCYANATWEATAEMEYDEETPLAHPCSPSAATHVELQRQDQVFWRVITSTKEVEDNIQPFKDDVVAASYESCVLTTLSHGPYFDKDVLLCPKTFDGWSCWNDTKAGDIASVHCNSHYHPGFDPKLKAHKVCLGDGTWFRHPNTNRSWSNYTTCVDQEDLEFRNQVSNLYVTGYSISVTALVISLFIFFAFKSLKCGRVTIHKNLFLSFIINNILWIIWYTTVIPYPDVMETNHVSCQVLHVLLQYFMVSNYFWMFCEGFYLHTLLVLAFVAETRVMRLLYVIGWGVPLILTIVYTCVRKSYEEAVHYCWIYEHKSGWILAGPVGISMFLNLAFLINIVRVLVTKLRAVNSPDSHHTRYYIDTSDNIAFLTRILTRQIFWKAARATLILIPLLGLHYVILPFRPEAGTSGESLYEITAAIATSFQGFCVSLLFCFFNGEVIALVRKKWKQEIMMRQQDRRTSYAATTISIGTRQSPFEDVHRLTSSRASQASQKLMSEL